MSPRPLRPATETYDDTARSTVSSVAVHLGLTPERPIPVSRAVRRLGAILGRAVTAPVWLSGEITECRRDPRGHTRFLLRDSTAWVECVVWATAMSATNLRLEDGLQVAIFGRPTLYERAARLQLSVLDVRRHGMGSIKLELDRLRQTLTREGLLDPRRRRRLPRIPRGVAVITSQTSAALEDIVAVARRRHPGIPLYVVPTQTQGPLAAASLVAALGIAQRADACDVVIVARGGGSQVDLAVYNDECVVRAIAACRLPVITAIGHERDLLLADEVADLRAATPSAAAERAIPTRRELATELRRLLDRLTQGIAARVNRAETRLRVARLRIGRIVVTRIEGQRARLVYTRDRLRSQAIHRVEGKRAELPRAARVLAAAMQRVVERRIAQRDRLATALTALDPGAILRRGYAIARDDRGHVVSSVADALARGAFVLQLADGVIKVHVAPSPNHHKSIED
jgi:exodeoxyribonuclease VII large subunit